MIMEKPTEKYVELISAFAIKGDFAPQFELLLGFHPEKRRWLTEREDDALTMSRYIKHDELLANQNHNHLASLALLWLEYFPTIKNLPKFNESDFYETLWSLALENAEPLDLIYSFYPAPGEKFQHIKNLANNAQRKLEEMISHHPKTKGKITWTFPFPANGPLGKLVENKIGISAELKQRVGLTRYAPGLLCNYLIQREISINELLNPYQFEDLVEMIFQEEGWETIKTPQTRDGGKDIIAKKMINDHPTIVYIEAKRYNYPIGISKVKEFVATVAGDKIDKGFFVTTSYFSPDSKTWLQTKGTELAIVELMEKPDIEKKLRKISNCTDNVYFISRYQ